MIWTNFKTDRLLIGAIINTEPVLREIIGWLNNPLVVRFSEQRHKRHTVDSQQRYINSFNGSNLYLAIYMDRALIGTATVMNDHPNQTANVGIMIGDHSKWGMGIGFEAWKAICDKLLASVTRKIEAGCMSCNLSMMSICSRYEMMEEGRQEDHFLYHDVPMDLVHWGKFK